MNTSSTTRHITLVGTTPLAKRLFALLQGQPNMVVRTTQTYDETSPPTDMVIEATGGLTPAFSVVMSALGQGIPCITANPLLMMVHGRVITTASRGQHATLMCTAALGAAAPLLGWLKSMPMYSLALSFPTAANAILTRMETRGEDFITAEQAVSAEDSQLHDVSGKYTLTCTATLYGQISGQWLPPQQATRMGLEGLTPTDVAAIRKLGLRLCYAAHMEEGQISAGVHAVPPTSPLLQGLHRAVVIASTTAGEVTLTQEAVTEEATAQTMLADVHQAFATPYRTPTYQPFAQAEPTAATYTIRVPYAAKETLLTQGATFLTESLDPTGTLTAVITCKHKPVAEGLILPMLGTYEATQTKLRLVG